MHLTRSIIRAANKNATNFDHIFSQSRRQTDTTQRLAKACGLREL